MREPIVKKYHKYTEHLASVFETREAWALCFRSNLMTRGNNTTNYVESTMRIVKDKVLYRLKAYNVTQLVDFLLTRMESYYTRRLLDVANNRTANIRQSRFFFSDCDVNCDNIVKKPSYITFSITISLELFPGTNMCIKIQDFQSS